jgi:dUTP pyrophosphatase
MEVKVKVKRIGGNDQALPFYATTQSAGMDLLAFNTADVIIKPRKRKLIPTGLAIELPVGFEGQIRPRSGLALKYGITILNSPGTIDSDFRGELKVLMINHGSLDFVVKKGDRIAQLVIAPVTKAKLIEAITISESSRGVSGFGHSGI